MPMLFRAELPGSRSHRGPAVVSVSLTPVGMEERPAPQPPTRLVLLLRHIRGARRRLEPEPERCRLESCASEPGPIIPEVASLPRSPHARRLTAAEIASFRERGFVSGLPVFAPECSASLVAKFNDIARRLSQLPEPLTTNEVFWFFKSNRWIYELTMVSQIHDYVEGLLGADFYLCASLFPRPSNYQL